MRRIHSIAAACGAPSSSTARRLKRQTAYSTSGLSRVTSCRWNPLAHRGAKRQCTCTRNLRLLMVTAKVSMQVMVKLSVAASSGKLDLSDCNLTEVPPEVCNIKGLEVSISCCGTMFVASTMLPLWSHFSPFAININLAPQRVRCQAFSHS